MSDELIVDASPLIVLAKIGLFDVLPKLSPVVLTTQPVYDEVIRKDDHAAHHTIEAARKWLEVLPAAEIPSDAASILQRFAVDEGEVSILVAAFKRPRCEVVLDDLAGRHAAEALRVPMVGTLGLVVRAHRQGLIPSGLTVVRAIEQSGLRVSPALLKWLETELSD